ncbi:MAG: prolipoprotein diacylglyceryl transferase [Anaerolineales bacterium]|nr:prolipoprotein diacylglyceryl transferase [Anaerolineales bacterium]
MFPIAQIGPLAVQVPGLLLLAGVWVGVEVADRWAKRIGVQPALISNLIFYALIGGILGARLGYVLRFLELYLEDPLAALALNPNTLSLPEGVLVAGLVGLVYGQRNELPFWSTLDALAPAFASFGVALGAAHLASGDAFGQPADVPWAIQLWGASRHPTQLYEIGLAALVLFALWKLRDRRPFPGALILAWVGMYGALLWLVGGLRGDSVIILGALRRGQVVGLAMMLMAMLLMHLRARGRLQPAEAQSGSSTAR